MKFQPIDLDNLEKFPIYPDRLCEEVYDQLERVLDARLHDKLATSLTNMIDHNLNLELQIIDETTKN